MSGPESLVERLLSDADDPWFDLSKYPGTIVWLKANWALREEAAAELSTLRSRCAELERERDEAEQKAERQWAGWVKEEVARKAAEAARDEAVRALEASERKAQAYLNSANFATDDVARLEAERDEAVRALREIIGLDSHIDATPRGGRKVVHGQFATIAARALTQPSGKEKGDG